MFFIPRLLPWTEKVARGTVVLTLLDRQDRPVAKPITKRLNDVIGTVEGGFQLHGGGTLNGRLSTSWLAIPS